MRALMLRIIKLLNKHFTLILYIKATNLFNF